MRVTVCELGDDDASRSRDWDALVRHASDERSELVLLPEMPFAPWFAHSPNYSDPVWQAAVDAHNTWMARLSELAPAYVLGSRPVNHNGRRLNEAFSWHSAEGYRARHHKYYLPNEDGFWEAAWYSRGDGSFDVAECGAVRVGFQICTELWALDESRAYAQQGVHAIAAPRATPHSTLEKWVVGGRAAAVCGGAYALSSNHVSSARSAVHLGGQGWIMGPDGEVLGLTSSAQPNVTVEIDLTVAEHAKTTYPRYVFAQPD